MGLHLHEHDVALLMKKYDHDHDGEISYGEFCSAMIAADYTDRSKGGTSKGQFHDGADGHEEMTLDEKVTVSKIQSKRESGASRIWKHANGSTVVSISITPTSFKPVSLSLPCFPLFKNTRTAVFLTF